MSQLGISNIILQKPVSTAQWSVSTSLRSYSLNYFTNFTKPNQLPKVISRFVYISSVHLLLGGTGFQFCIVGSMHQFIKLPDPFDYNFYGGDYFLISVQHLNSPESDSVSFHAKILTSYTIYCNWEGNLLRYWTSPNKCWIPVISVSVGSTKTAFTLDVYQVLALLPNFHFILI